MGAPTAYALVRPVNEPSIQLALRLGMQPQRSVEYAGYEHVVMALDRNNGASTMF